MSDALTFFLAISIAVLFGSLFGSLLHAGRSFLARLVGSSPPGRIARDGSSVVEFRKAGRRSRRIRLPRVRLPQMQKPNVAAFLLIVFAVGLGLFFKSSGPLPFTGSTLEGRVTHVRDGDTIVVSGTPIRFAKLDCAELGTAQGDVAKRRMFELASGQYVVCRLHGRKSYDREIGECGLSDGRDLSRVMLREGVCRRWW